MQIQQTRKALFWPSRIEPFGPNWGFGGLICMRTEIRDQELGLLLYKPAPLCLEAYCPFHPRLKIAFPWLSWTTKDVSLEQSGAEHSTAKQTRMEYSRPEGDEQMSSQTENWSQSCSQPCCSHSHIVSQWCCCVLKNSFLLHCIHNWGFLLAVIGTNNHQWTTQTKLIAKLALGKPALEI